jgi:hypothetical protein
MAPTMNAELFQTTTTSSTQVKVDIVQPPTTTDKQSVSGGGGGGGGTDALPLLPDAIMLKENEWRGIGLRFECLTNGDVDVPLIYRPLLHGNSSDSGDTFDESYGAAMVPVNVTIAGFNGLKSVVLQYNKKCGGHKKGLKVWVPSSHLYVPLLHWCTVV